MFMDCQYAKDVWALSPYLMPLPPQAGDLYIWLLSLSPTFTKSELDHLSKALLICWKIWEARNNMVFHDSKATLASCFFAAAYVGLDFWRLNSKARLGSADSMMIKWNPPPIGWIKINFDGSLMNSHASTGFVIRDSEGHVLIAGSNNIAKIPFMLRNVLLFVMVLPLHLIEDGIKL
ncbi:hypothetical protein L3X38_041618 [Prunus dulcis]|uniref:RNase H type-1 domain-containing protein n=1 Tax=Prunus dulcis TaxID=3755 RepID=A0AAD4YKJ4_PRUDU|nr:hypothetical protein L3X38_041618 [Prunus dulcis]